MDACCFWKASSRVSTHSRVLESTQLFLGSGVGLSDEYVGMDGPMLMGCEISVQSSF